jgi:hypothetical protein
MLAGVRCTSVHIISEMGVRLLPCVLGASCADHVGFRGQLVSGTRGPCSLLARVGSYVQLAAHMFFFVAKVDVPQLRNMP